jgi:2-methylcitrate dehydratase PrpD
MSITTAASTTTETLARFVSGLRSEDVPVEVRERVKDLLLDAIASAFAGAGSDEVAQVTTLARTIAGDAPEATVIGGAPAPVAAAAMINGYLITAATVCDVHRATLCHVMPEALPPAMAATELRGASGATFVSALAAGLEVTTRIGLGLNYPAFRARGWHSPGVVGPFGGAASAGRVIGLDQRRQRNALGLAGSQAAGTFAHWGTPTIKFHQSRGALSGLLAAFLAETGFEAAPDILGAPDGGLFGTYSDHADPAATVDGLGQRWELMNISMRRWPVASSIQSVVTALLALLDAHPVPFAEIGGIRISLSPDTYRMHGELGWDTRFRALLSTRFVAAVIAADRRCWLEQFTPERIADPDLDRFARQRVQVQAMPELSTYAALVELETTDGRRWADRRDVPKGDPAAPLMRAEVVDKFHDAARQILSSATREQVVADIAEIEAASDVSSLVRKLGGRIGEPDAAGGNGTSRGRAR